MAGAKYQQILEDLQEQMRLGQLKYGAQLPTEKQYMARYGVSRTTVQRAMNILVANGLVQRISGKGSFICGEYIPAGIQEKMPEGKGLVKKEFTMILPYRSNVIIRYFVGAQRALEAKGATLTARFREADYESELPILRAAINTGSDGVLLYPNDLMMDQAYSRFIAGIRIPTVTLDKRIPGVNFSGAGSDDYAGGAMIANYFADRGHTRCAYLSASFCRCNTVYERYMGYSSALRSRGIELERRYTLVAKKLQAGRHNEYLLDFLRDNLHDLPTAIFCSTDEFASDLYNAAATLGIKIPQQLSVVGYDDLEFSSFLLPPLTTVRQPYEQIGEVAGRLLWDAATLKNPNVSYIQVPAELVERESVATLL